MKMADFQLEKNYTFIPCNLSAPASIIICIVSPYSNIDGKQAGSNKIDSRIYLLTGGRVWAVTGGLPVFGVCLPFRGQSTSKSLIRHHQTVWSQLCGNSYISALGAQCNRVH